MNQCAVCCSKQFGPNGCQVPVLTDSGSATTCGETQTLDILREIRNEFDNKMRQIEDEAGGDCYLGLQAKLHLQQEWIRSLTVQNEMLVDAVKELEIEASNRVLKLEEKLENSAQIGSEVMQKYRNFTYSINLDETFQKLEYLRSDIKNLLEFIRRIRIDGRWNIEGLQFYDVTYQDLFGSCACNVGCVDPSLDMEKVHINVYPGKSTLQQIEDKIKQKDDEIESIKRSMVDMRNSLTDKVAEKHNIILNLHRDVQRLEEQCRLASQHTQFKEEMIKELRKEIKALKGGACPQLTIQSKKASKILDATTVLHNCCPYVKDFCPMYLKTKVSSCMLSPINMENSKTTLNIQSPRAVRDVPAYDDDQTPTRDSLIEFSNPTIIELSRSRSFTHGEPVPRKQKTKLTATRVLHEYYGFKKDEEIYGNVETFSKIPKKINVVIPNHVPVKTFINNLEKNVVSNVEIENEKLKTEVSINELNHETH